MEAENSGNGGQEEWVRECGEETLREMRRGEAKGGKSGEEVCDWRRAVRRSEGWEARERKRERKGGEVRKGEGRGML